MVIKANENNFDDLISKGKVLVDFSANWCGDCRALWPNFERASDTIGDVDFVIADVDAMPQLRERFGINSIPTTIFFKKSVEVRRYVDFMTIEKINELVK